MGERRRCCHAKIRNSNQAPIVQAPVTELDLLFGEEQIIESSNIFFDPDEKSFGDELTYSIEMSDGTTLPTWMEFNQQGS